MDTRTQDVPGYYVWEAPGAGVVVHLNLDVVDRLSIEVMRGFGAVRKRGAEIGGLLTGTIEQGFPAIARIEGFVPVPCEYRRGPSYLFTEEDSPAFDEAHQRFQPIGYFRSHTREGFELCDDDTDLLDHFFPNPSQIALLIRPFAAQASLAGIFLRTHGVFSRTAAWEFPFKRELLGGAVEPLDGAADRDALAETDAVAAQAEPGAPNPVDPSTGQIGLSSVAEPFPAAPRGPDIRPALPSFAKAELPREEKRKPLRRSSDSGRTSGWVWIPLSFLFLVVGGLLGFEAARSRGGESPVSAGDFSLSLRASKADANVSVKWNGQAAAVQSASKGRMEIEDGATRKSVDLDAAQLRNGSLLYQSATSEVEFRLIVFPRAQVSVTETLRWKSK